MVKMSKLFKIGLVISFIIGIFAALVITLYLYVLPELVKNSEFLEFIQKTVKESCGAELIIEKPVLKTSLKLLIDFKSNNIMLTKNGEILLQRNF